MPMSSDGGAWGVDADLGWMIQPRKGTDHWYGWKAHNLLPLLLQCSRIVSLC